jgi:hypothetical protein
MANKPQNDWTQDDQDNYDSTYQNVSDEQDKLGDWILAAITLTATGQVLSKLSERDIAIIKEEITKEASTYLEVTPMQIDEMVANIIPLQEIEIPFRTEVFSNFIDEKDLSYYQQLSEQFKQYGRIEDPKSIENLHWQNQQSIMDQVGLFGNTESSKSGILDTLIKSNDASDSIVMIPWVCAGDNTCEECAALDGNLYLPEDYPEPFHYGCECLPGDPVAVQQIDVGSDDVSETLTIVYCLY